MKQLQEIRHLSPLERQLLEQLKGIIARFVPDATVLLYGSAARGTREPDSDYDILVITPASLGSPDEDRIYDAAYDLELEHNIIFSLIFMSVEEWNSPLSKVSPYHRNVESEGVLI